MTNFTMLVLCSVLGLGLLWLGLLSAWVWLLWRGLGEVARALRAAPLTPSQCREPEPGSYILSDAEAAQVEAALLAESRGRATSRGARGWRGFKSS